MKNIYILIIFLTCIQTGYSQDAPSKQIVNDVSEQMQAWLYKIPPGSEQQYGFNDRDEFMQANPGEPFLVFTLAPHFFTGQLQPDDNYLEPTGELRIPVMVGEEYKALLTVVKAQDKWEIVALGAKILAKELQLFSQKPPFSTADQIYILRIYQAYSDFLFTDDPGTSSSKLDIYPLQSAVKNIGIPESNKDTVLKLSVLFPKIKDIHHSIKHFENKP